MHIKSLGFPTRIYNALIRVGLDSTEKLSKCSRKDLEKIRCLGVSSVSEIIIKLRDKCNIEIPDIFIEPIKEHIYELCFETELDSYSFHKVLTEEFYKEVFFYRVYENSIELSTEISGGCYLAIMLDFISNTILFRQYGTKKTIATNIDKYFKFIAWFGFEFSKYCKFYLKGE